LELDILFPDTGVKNRKHRSFLKNDKIAEGKTGFAGITIEVPSKDIAMNPKIIGLVLILAFAFPAVNWAEDSKTELVLFKEVSDPWTLFKKGRTCESIFHLRKGVDAPDLRDMRNSTCRGEYTLTLDGPPGTTITLYGQFFFGEDRGFLTLTKTDNQKVWIWDLEDFPDGKWVVAEANKNTGGYEIFYRAGPDFKMNLGSVKWHEVP
jgi:hypothetical protein